MLVDMGYVTKVQVIERANATRQFYVICPAPLAEALGLGKSEPIEWEIEDRWTLRLRRPAAGRRPARRRSHGR
jgi:hypothetical protein